MSTQHPLGEEDREEAEYMKSLEACPEVCPACGSDDLHSASLGGEAAISCGGCVWIATIASFQSDQAPSGGTDHG
jgi:hypothetical protein